MSTKEPIACARCGAALGPDDVTAPGGKPLCEDCLMDSMSPARACDPWAVKMAKGSAKTTGEAAAALQGLERALYDLVCAEGRVAKGEAPGRLGVSPTQLERAFATLRHMELLRGERGEGGAVSYVRF